MDHLDLSCLPSTMCFVTGQAPKLSFRMSSVLALLLGDPCDDEDRSQGAQIVNSREPCWEQQQ